MNERMQRMLRRARKLPKRVILRLQGYDNTSAILLEPFEAIYFQIPKVASTSMKRMLKAELGIGGIGVHATRFPEPDLQRLAAGDYDNYFKFCFVRNPWARIVSCYESKISRGININQVFWVRCLHYLLPHSAGPMLSRLSSSPVFHKHMSFAEFVDAVCAVPDKHADKHFRAQCYYLCDTNGNLRVNFVGHLESLEDDYREIAKRVKFSRSELELRGQSDRRPYRDYYDESTWSKVAQRYAQDVELLGYADCKL